MTSTPTTSLEPPASHARPGFENFVVQPHHYTLFELTPGYRSPDGLTTHNRHGFRGSDFSIVKPPGTFRIVCMGESSTYCTGVDRDDETYPGRLAHHLDSGSRRFEVINAGVPAYNSAENLMHFVFRVQPLQPDLVIYYFTHNDVIPRRCPSLSRDYREFCKVWGDAIWGNFDHPNGTWTQRLRARLPFRAKVDPDVGIGPQVRHYSRLDYENIPRTSALHFRDNLTNLFALARHWNIQTMMMLPSYPSASPKSKRSKLLRIQAVNEHRTLAAEVAGKFSAPVIDLQRELDATPASSRETLYSDAAHFTTAGCDWAAVLTARAIKKSVSADL